MPNCKQYCHLLAVAIAVPAIHSQVSAYAQSIDTPATRLKPISAPSAVDAYLAPRSAQTNVTATQSRETAYQVAPTPSGAVTQVAMQVPMPAPGNPITLPPSAGGPISPSGNMPTPAPTYTNPTMQPIPGAPQPVPNSVQPMPRALPPGPGPSVMNPIPSAPLGSSTPYVDDQIPLGQPQLSDQFATMGNNCCVSGPSDYTAAMDSGCVPVAYQTQVVQPVSTPVAATNPAAVAVPVAQPIGQPVAVPAKGVPKGALISFGQEKYPVQVGQGLYGQPVAYVPGQKFRNWIRYVFP